MGDDMYEKIYVAVTVKIDENGDIRPLAIIWEDGAVYEIDRVRYKINAASLKGGGRGVRYTVVIEGKERYLFDEDGRWFVERKALK